MKETKRSFDGWREPAAEGINIVFRNEVKQFVPGLLCLLILPMMCIFMVLPNAYHRWLHGNGSAIISSAVLSGVIIILFLLLLIKEIRFMIRVRKGDFNVTNGVFESKSTSASRATRTRNYIVKVNIEPGRSYNVKTSRSTYAKANTQSKILIAYHAAKGKNTSAKTGMWAYLYEPKTGEDGETGENSAFTSD